VIAQAAQRIVLPLRQRGHSRQDCSILSHLRWHESGGHSQQALGTSADLAST